MEARWTDRGPITRRGNLSPIGRHRDHTWSHLFMSPTEKGWSQPLRPTLCRRASFTMSVEKIWWRLCNILMIYNSLQCGLRLCIKIPKGVNIHWDGNRIILICTGSPRRCSSGSQCIRRLERSVIAGGVQWCKPTHLHGFAISPNIWARHLWSMWW